MFNSICDAWPLKEDLKKKPDVKSRWQQPPSLSAFLPLPTSPHLFFTKKPEEPFRRTDLMAYLSWTSLQELSSSPKSKPLSLATSPLLYVTQLSSLVSHPLSCVSAPWILGNRGWLPACFSDSWGDGEKKEQQKQCQPRGASLLNMPYTPEKENGGDRTLIFLSVGFSSHVPLRVCALCTPLSVLSWFWISLMGNSPLQCQGRFSSFSRLPAHPSIWQALLPCSCSPILLPLKPQPALCLPGSPVWASSEGM